MRRVYMGATESMIDARMVNAVLRLRTDQILDEIIDVARRSILSRIPVTGAMKVRCPSCDAGVPKAKADLHTNSVASWPCIGWFLK